MKYYCPKCKSELEEIIFDCHHPTIDLLKCKKCNLDFDTCPSSFFDKECILTKGHKGNHISCDNITWPNIRSLV